MNLCVQTMRVDQLPNGRHQPFYQILVDERDRPDGRITYVAQVKLILKPILTKSMVC